MRMPRKLLVAALGIAGAAVFFVPGAPAHAAALPAAHAAASAPSPVGAELTPSGGASHAASSAVDPECKLYYMNQQGKPGGLAHISSFLYHNHKIRAVKINAAVQCRRVSMDLFLQVTLWKTGLLFPHKVAGPTTATAAKGNLLKNQMTWKQCKNNASTTYYGTAYGRVVFQGVTYSASLQSGNATLACGT
ncbi:MAG: hypothetical protein JO242_28950 [Streptosporangiaceae bacterium]|nr:hypothetical protein [Streptosporangiaceae bacterium]